MKRSFDVLNEPQATLILQKLLLHVVTLDALVLHVLCLYSVHHIQSTQTK